MLEGKTLAVTGARGALGSATVERAQALGAEVIGIDIVPAEGAANYLQLDLTDRGATAEALAGLDKLDGLLNIAGGFAMGTAAAEPTDDEWDAMFRINVSTVRNATMAVVPRFKEQGRGSIVNVGALGALSGAADMSAYICAKSAVMRLTESLSEELRHQGINVNAVLPSLIDTPINREGMPDADYSQWVSPQQLADVICFLASDAAGAVHGALLPVRGLV